MNNKTDKKIAALGFTKVEEDEFGARYERVDGCIQQVVSILHKNGGRHIIQSYDKNLFDEKKIGCTAVGLTYKENRLFLKKMKQIRLHK